MDIVEIVHLRAIDGSARSLVDRLRASLDGAPGSQVMLLTRPGVDTDLAVFIHRPAGEPGTLGLRIADALREHGLVQHTTWRSVALEREER